MYEISLTIGNDTYSEVYTGSGTTLLEALESLKKPNKITMKSTLKVSDGTKSFERPLTVPKTKRLFYPLSQKVLSKYFTRLLQ